MARDLDGTDDYLDMGSDASIDGIVAVSFSMWFNLDLINPSLATSFLTKDLAGAHWRWGLRPGDVLDPSDILFTRDWLTTDGDWSSFEKWDPEDKWMHFCGTYDGGSIFNDPTMRLDGVALGIEEAVAPAGSLVSDAPKNLLFGALNQPSPSSFANGAVACLTYTTGLWSAAQINRARWWGRPGGALDVYHPMWTSKTANEGVATADLTVVGATMVAAPIPVVRPGTAMMGMGVGW